jgi:hypothetical protein
MRERSGRSGPILEAVYNPSQYFTLPIHLSYMLS